MIFILYKVNKSVVYACPKRQEEAGAGTELVKEKQLLFLAQLAVVALSRAALELLPLLH